MTTIERCEANGTGEVMTVSTNKKPGLGCLPLLVVGALAVGGGLYYFRGELIGKELTPIEAAQAIPETAVATSFISTNAQDWSKLSNFGTPEAQKLVQQNLDSLTKELDANAINYEQDIKPWLGGVMITFLPSSTSTESDVLIIAGLKNKLKARDFEKKIRAQPGQKITETKYQNIPITTITTKDNISYSFAVTSNYLILANKTQTIEQAIDTLKGKPSYAQKKGAKEVLSRSLNLKNPLVTVYITDYGALLKQSFSQSSTPISPELLKQIQQVESVVLGVGVETEGLHFQAVSQLSDTAPQRPVKNSSGKILNRFPAETFALVSGQGIKEAWSTLVTQSEKDQDIKTVVDQVRQGTKMINLDADKEVFGWMDGEFGIGMNFTSQTVSPLGLGGMMVWETSDRKTAQNTLDKLSGLVKLYEFAIESNKSGNVDVTEWKQKQSEQLLLSYGWLDNNSLAMTFVMPFSIITDVKSGNALPDSQSFRTITSSLPKDNLGYFYLDMNKTVGEMTRIAEKQGATPDPNVMSVLNSIQGLAVTATLPNKTTSQLDMLLALKSNQSKK